MACRRLCGVSPVRTATRISGRGVPADSARAAMPASGSLRFRSMSLDSALRGETYTTSVRSGRPPPSPARTSPSRQVRNAASVFPEPVGAAISVCRPLAMAGQPRAWASVGPSNRPSNHAWTRGWNIPSMIHQERRTAQPPGAQGLSGVPFSSIPFRLAWMRSVRSGEGSTIVVHEFYLVKCNWPGYRAFSKSACPGRTCAMPHLDSRLRGNDDMRFSGQ